MDTVTAAGSQMGSNVARANMLGVSSDFGLKKIAQNPTMQNNQIGYGSYSLLSGPGFVPLVDAELPKRNYEE